MKTRLLKKIRKIYSIEKTTVSKYYRHGVDCHTYRVYRKNGRNNEKIGQATHTYSDAIKELLYSAQIWVNMPIRYERDSFGEIHKVKRQSMKF